MQSIGMINNNSYYMNSNDNDDAYNDNNRCYMNDSIIDNNDNNGNNCSEIPCIIISAFHKNVSLFRHKTGH